MIFSTLSKIICDVVRITSFIIFIFTAKLLLLLFSGVRNWPCEGGGGVGVLLADSGGDMNRGRGWVMWAQGRGLGREQSQYDDSIQHLASPLFTTSPSPSGLEGTAVFWETNTVYPENSPHRWSFRGQPVQTVSSSDHEVSFLRISRCFCLMKAPGFTPRRLAPCIHSCHWGW